MTEEVRAFIDETLTRSADLDRAAPACSPHRAAAREVLSRSGLPSGRIEHWKYTPITRFYDRAFAVPEAVSKAESPAPSAPLAQEGAIPVRFAGGAPEFGTATLPDGLTMVRFAAADADQRALIEAHIDHEIDTERHPLNLVNMALIEDGLLIHVAAGAEIEQPIDLQLLTGGRSASCERILVVLEPGAGLALFEQHASSMPRNQVLELHVGEAARLEHTRVQTVSRMNAWQLIQTEIAQRGRYRFNGYTLGGAPHRNELHVRLLGEGADAELKGAFLTARRQRLDHQHCIEHVAPGCRSRQQFHGIALNRSELTFNGRIHIHAHAQRSDARLSNKNLLGHDSARINTKPELEIYADDVQCAHGATVGQLDESELYYLRARGIELAQARAMLLRGFIGAVLPAGDEGDAIGALYEEALAPWMG